MKPITSFLSLIMIGLVTIAFSCAPNEDDDGVGMTPSVTKVPNILLIIADDLGKDAISGFSEGNIKPNTPNIDAVRADGLTFDNLWVYPTCTPTRASIITGKYGYRTGLKWAGDELSASEKTLQTYIREETIIIFLGDNGTPGDVAQSPYSENSSKGSLYQGGVNVPMFISGQGVSRSGVDENMVTSTDLFATIAEIAGVNVTEINDSKSFKSLLTQSTATRDYQYAELENDNNDAWAIRNDQYKLIISTSRGEEMYDLTNDPYEQTNLLDGTLTPAGTSNKEALETELLRIRN